MFERSAATDLAPQGSRPAVTAEVVEGWTAALTDDPLLLDDAARIDLLRALEQLKCAAEGAQSAAAADFERSQRQRAAERGIPEARRGRGIAEQIALARRESPHRGRAHLRLARVLREQLTATGAALRAGKISEYKASLLMAETACLGADDRIIVDATLAGDADRIEAMGDREAAAAARKLAAELDAASVAERRRRAEADRNVTLRPAPDTMTWLSALLPVKEGVAVHAALRAAAEAARNHGDPRSRGQVMADTLVDRVTGRESADSVGSDVSVDLVMTDRALLTGDSEEAAWIQGYGPVPADLARELVRHALDAGDRAWLTRLYTHPATGELTSMDSRQRRFRGTLAKLIRLRDQTCRTPWCGAPVRDADHATEAHAGGATSQSNSQGLCQGCNLAKQAPQWRAESVAGVGHQIETTTPTGHRYRSRAPALARPPYRQVRPGVWRLVA